MTDKNYNYGVIGNCFSAALVSEEGSIDWCCLPRFDSPFVFSKLLDSKIGGSFGVIVSDDYNISQKYISNTNILQTIFTSKEAAFEIIDFMPRYHRTDSIDRYYCPPDIIRVFRPITGSPKLKIKYDPKLYYAEHETSHQVANGFIKSNTEKGVYESCYLYSNFDHESIIQSGEITLKNESYCLLSYHQKIVKPDLKDVKLTLEKTKVYWMDWVYRIKIPKTYSEQVTRSALTLKLLTFQPTGAVLAALTTSLPETVGKERNWDYRFCWVRDASMTVSVFKELGINNSVIRFLHYILNLISYKDEKMQIMYGINGNKDLTEETLDQLSWLLGLQTCKSWQRCIPSKTKRHVRHPT